MNQRIANLLTMKSSPSHQDQQQRSTSKLQSPSSTIKLIHHIPEESTLSQAFPSPPTSPGKLLLRLIIKTRRDEDAADTKSSTNGHAPPA